MPPIYCVSNSHASLPSRNDFHGGEVGGITGHDNLQMSNADALRTQFSLADALRAVHGDAEMESGAVNATAAALNAAANLASAIPSGIGSTIGAILSALQDHQSSPEQLDLPPGTAANSSSSDSPLASPSYHSEPAKHL